ncbi:MAG: ATP-dependent DNA ligase [Candidatus Xenobia bacterium]
MTRFLDLAKLSRSLKATPGRLASVRLIVEFLRRLSAEEIRPAVRTLLGRVARKLEVSGAALGKVVRQLAGPGPLAAGEDMGESVRLTLQHFPDTATLSLLEVYQRLQDVEAVHGKGAMERRIGILVDLYRKCTADEVEVLTRIVLKEMRHGADEGVVLDALAEAAGLPREDVTRAQMLLGDLAEVAHLVLLEGRIGLSRVGLTWFRPIQPMLAQKADSVAEALARFGGRASLELKLDGARVQVHKQGDVVRLFSRRLTEVTESLPEMVEAIRQAVSTENAMLEGELIPVDAGGRPQPFQELMRRFRRIHAIDGAAQEVPVQLFLFDTLAEGDELLLDRPEEERWAALERILRPHAQVTRVSRLVTSDAAAGEAYYQDAVARGYEGVMAKDLRRPYTPGVRGGAWLKIKRIHTLDMVIVAADWGYGRRQGWLSNYHLAVRDEAGQLAECGKTFKGLTDEEFRRMTERLMGLKTTSGKEWTVNVRPEVVVEVAFEGVQKSSQYACGLALRFARITRIRDDKAVDEIDTLASLQAEFDRQAAAAF